MKLSTLTRALRLPFITTSIIPFVFGSLIEKNSFNYLGFLLGLITASCTLLSANLINDYADSKSGVDWKDLGFYGFFGGSKLIQEGALSEKAYLRLAIIFAAVSLSSAILLLFVLKSALTIISYFIIIILSWQYSAKPLSFSYRYLGETFIFILFGPALVMGGYFIQSGVFPDLKSLSLSLPMGFFVTAILFSNEIADFSEDKKSGKHNLVRVVGVKNAYLMYLGLSLSGFLSIVINVLVGYLNALSLLSLLFIIPMAKAAAIQKRSYLNKKELVNSSKQVILVQNLTGVVLILARLI